MRRMKALFCLAVTAIMMLAIITGCASQGNQTTTGSSGGEANGKDKIVLGFSQVGAESGWRVANTKSIKSAAKADSQIKLKFSDARQKQQNQIKAIRSFIAQKVDVIAFSPVVETGWVPVLNEAKRAGIPVILTDRRIASEDTSLYETYIGSDFVEEGKKAAKWLVNYMDTKEPVNIAVLEGTVGSAPAIDRGKGFKEVLKKYPNYKIIRSQTGNFTRAQGKEVMEAFLKAEGDNIDVLFAHNDDMAIGAIQAIKEYGLDPGKDIVIVSVDGVKDALEAIKAGDLNASIECNPLFGPELMKLAKKVAAGEDVPRWIRVEEGIFTKENAAEALPNRKY